MKKYRAIILFLVAFLPATINAQSQTNGACGEPISNISAVFHLVGCIIGNALIPMLVSLSIIVFMIGIIKYIAGAGDATKREEGRTFMLYGIVALFVMVSIWGLVGIISGTFGLPNIPLIPQLQGV
jgi:hypothetical protein